LFTQISAKQEAKKARGSFVQGYIVTLYLKKRKGAGMRKTGLRKRPHFREGWKIGR
jgi:hypothetical protein